MHKSISVQGSREGRIPLSIEVSPTYRDKMPIQKNNRTKRIFLKGASNRVKSMNEEQAFAELGNERKNNEKLYKNTRNDQLVQIRNIHLTHRLSPLSKSIASPKFIQITTQLKVETHETGPELVYQAQPVVQKARGSQYLIGQSVQSPKQEYSRQMTHSSWTPMNAQKNKTESNYLMNAIQTLKYGSIKMKTQVSKQGPPTPNNQNIPQGFAATKQYLKQFL